MSPPSCLSKEGAMEYQRHQNGERFCKAESFDANNILTQRRITSGSRGVQVHPFVQH